MKQYQTLLVPDGCELTLENFRDGLNVLRYSGNTPPRWLEPTSRPRVVRVPSKYPDTFHPRRYTCVECKRPIHGRGLVSTDDEFRGRTVRVHARCTGSFRPGYLAKFSSFG